MSSSVLPSSSGGDRPIPGGAELFALPTAVLEMTYEAEETVFFPTASAGIWRGQLGAALRRAAAARRHGKDGSTYDQLFRSPQSAVQVPDRPARILGPIGLAGEHVPHPFVLRVEPVGHRESPLRLHEGDRTVWSIVLVGRAVRHIPALTAVLDGLAKEGIGRVVSQWSGRDRRGRMHLRAATLEVGRLSLDLYDGTDWYLPSSCDATLYEQAAMLTEPAPREGAPGAPEQVAIEFETPVRLMHAEAALTAPSVVSAPALAQASYRRWAALALCYTPDPPSTGQLDAAFEKSRALGRRAHIADRDLTATERTRYSARQEELLPRPGLSGTVRLGGPPDVLREWKGRLDRCAPLHLGKSTAMGCGRFSVTAH